MEFSSWNKKADAGVVDSELCTAKLKPDNDLVFFLLLLLPYISNHIHNDMSYYRDQGCGMF